MIEGQVRQLAAIIPLSISGAEDRSLHVHAIVDTGFNGFLTLHREQIAELELPYAGHREGKLADGSQVLLDVWAKIEWHGISEDAIVLQTFGAPLVGMSLLRGSRLFLDVIEKGEVHIVKISDERAISE